MMKGAAFLKGRGVDFNLWAPRAQKVMVKLLEEPSRIIPMLKDAEGSYRIQVPDVSAGTEYLFVLDGEELADPASQRQRRGVYGPSCVVDHTFPWSDGEWKAFPLKDYYLYELHIGTFTEEGTFEAAISKLPHLKKLGITAIELMPVASFPGERDWGYNGAFLYAPQESYGGPAGLKKLVNACHLLEIAVVLDTVYNHVGPEGNPLAKFGPYFTDKYHCPWGQAINFDDRENEQVREFIIENALFWFREYHIDALRLDASDKLFDNSAYPILEELRGRTAGLGLLILETDLNDARILTPKEGYQIDAQWNDGFHHALLTIFTGRQDGYLIDYGKMSDLTKGIAEGFIYDHRWSVYRQSFHGSSSKHIRGEQFIIFFQNHDQIANTCHGMRFGTLFTKEQEKMALAILLFSPNIPLLFMGQELRSKTPFYFFSSFIDPKIAHAASEGRKKEHFLDKEFIDPQDKATFLASKINWSDIDEEMLEFYQQLIALRKKTPALANCRKDLTEVHSDEEKKWLIIKREDPSGSRAMLTANLSDQKQAIPLFPGDWHLHQSTGNGPWSMQIYLNISSSSLLSISEETISSTDGLKK